MKHGFMILFYKNGLDAMESPSSPSPSETSSSPSLIPYLFLNVVRIVMNGRSTGNISYKKPFILFHEEHTKELNKNSYGHIFFIF